MNSSAIIIFIVLSIAAVGIFAATPQLASALTQSSTQSTTQSTTQTPGGTISGFNFQSFTQNQCLYFAFSCG